jgi:signal transduction histidine kinase/DNA-binding response OmpR family regulator
MAQFLVGKRVSKGKRYCNHDSMFWCYLLLASADILYSVWLGAHVTNDRDTAMTLRTKTLAIIGCTLLGVILLLQAASAVVLLNDFSELETQTTRQSVAQSSNAIANQLENLATVTRDYAYWDLMYAYAESRDPEFVANNLADDALTSLGLNVAVITDVDGNAIYTRTHDADDQLPPALTHHLVAGGALNRAGDGKSRGGLLMLPDGPLLVAAEPLLTNMAKGPARGTLVMGYYLTEDRVAELEGITQLQLDLYVYGGANLPGDVRLAVAELYSQPVVVRVINDDLVGGYQLIRDLDGQPSMILRVTSARVIYSQGIRSVRSQALVLAAAGIAAVLLTLMLLERMVLARVARLSAVVTQVRSSGDLSVRAPVDGRDELATLGGEFNHMLTALSVGRRDLEQARDEAEQANQAKSTFLSNMSHELRTPLNAIIGYSEMLSEDAAGAGEEDMASDLQKIHVAGRHLLDLINDILDLSKIEAGKLELSPEHVSIRMLVEDVAELTHPMIEKNGNRLQIELPDPPGTIWVDQMRLRQILLNLVSNAAKFTERGTVTLRIMREERAADGGARSFFRFDVQDTGIGLTPEQQQRLFQPFMQADTSTTRKYGGTGLGLAITRRLCQMMGGDITLTSAAGSGSTFSVWLPAAPERSADQPGPHGVGALIDAQGVPLVLVIDDDQAVRDYVSHVLTHEGMRVVVAADGDAGVRMARELRPDLITLDVMMPGVDGWTVLTMLKDDPQLRNIPVVMLTMVDEREAAYTLGASAFLNKPVERDRLLEVLERLGHERARRHILLVEDDITTRQMMRRLLEREGWSVREAANGQIGLRAVEESPPAMILLDLMMPEMDGFTFAATVRRNPAWSTIPIIVVTAKDLTPEDRIRLNGYVELSIQKGLYRREDLLAEVRALVRVRARQPGQSG